MSKPLVTVGIPFFNSAFTIETTIASIFAQTYDNWEIILIDDGSTDNSLEIAKRYEGDRVRVFSDGRNFGQGMRHNEITRLAKGELIAKMDSDDLSHSRRLEYQVEHLLKNQVDVVDTAIVGIDESLRAISVRNLKPLPERLSPFDQYRKCLLTQGSVLAKTEWFKRFPYDESLRRTEDRELWLRSYPNSRFSRLPQPLCFVREVGNEQIILKKYLVGYAEERRIMMSLGVQDLGLPSAAFLAAHIGLKTAAIYALTALGRQRQQIIRRGDPPAEAIIEETRREIARIKEVEQALQAAH